MSRNVVALITALFLQLPFFGARAQEQLPEPTDTLTLRDALALVLLRNPELRAFSFDLRAAEARLLQAGLRRNPELAFTAENLGGTVPLSDPELTLSLAQMIELGGKRKARVAIARGEAAVINLNYEATRLVLLFEVQRHFLEAIALEKLLGLSQETVRIAEEMLNAVRAKVRAGSTSPAEATRSEVELAKATLEMELLRERLRLSYSRLSALWGTPRAQFRSISGSLDSLVTLPSLDSLLTSASKSPDLERWEAEVHVRASRIALARAQRVPDLGLHAGYRALLESNDHTFVAGLSLPLPFFDRNQGSIAEAHLLTSSSSEQLANARLSRALQIIEAHSALSQERTRIELLRADVIPGARRAYSELRLGYERGRFGYLDLLEARRTWTEAEREKLLSLLTFHATLAELERLVGGRVSAAAPGGPR